jgi:uncharacterized protein YegL
MDKFINKISIDFHSDLVKMPIEIFNGRGEGKKEKFGIISLKLEKTEIIKNPIFILFSIDNTASMSETCKGGFSKLHYLKQTFKNMIEFLATIENAEIYIKVHSFNRIVNVIVDNVRIIRENINNIISKIMALKAESITAIDNAFNEARETIKKYISEYSLHDVTHIFMTDGEPTTGIKNHNLLIDLIDESYSNVFIGFGKDHNVDLLRKCGNLKMAYYDFVDNIEYSGIVYGEIIHNILYPILKDVSIEIENGLLYDWKTNSWVTYIYEEKLIGESNKIYHIKSADCEEVSVKIFGIPFYEIGEPKLLEYFCILNDYDESNEKEKTDLSKYIFRQSVLELLYKTNNTYDFIEDININDNGLKNEINNIFSKIYKYMRENNLLQDFILKQLCDDLAICHNTLGTPYAKMYSLARQTSQGRQQTHNITIPDCMANILIKVNSFDSDDNHDLDNVENLITPLYHPSDIDDNNFKFYEKPKNNSASDDNIENYIPSNDCLSCFASPSLINTIRSVSAGII